jgi:serine/threonine protein kinase
MSKKKPEIKYELIGQLGEKGKEGRTLSVRDIFGCEYAMKTFRRNKPPEKLMEEITLQRKCSDAGISPKIIDYSLDEKYVVMEQMECHLLDSMKDMGGLLSEGHQKQLIEIFKKLDKIKVFQGDANILNYMLRNGKIYIIDFGFSKHIDENLMKKLESRAPNYELMLLGFILKLKEMNCPPQSYSILKTHLTEQKRAQFNI